MPCCLVITRRSRAAARGLRFPMRARRGGRDTEGAVCILRSRSAMNVIQALKRSPTFRVSDRREFQCVGSVAAAVEAGLNSSRACLRSADRHAYRRYTCTHRRTQARYKGTEGTEGTEGMQQDADANALTTLCTHGNNCITSGSGSPARARRRLQLSCQSMCVSPRASIGPSLALV